MRSIAGFATFLEEEVKDGLTDEGRLYVERIRAAGDRAQQLITDLLKLARVGRTDRERAPMDAGAVIDALREDLSASLQQKNGEIRVLGPLPTVVANAVQLREVFVNLIGNGLKFNRSEHPLVTVRATEEAGQAHFVVEDNGIGIDPEYHGKVFQVFSRLHTQEEYEGSGAGLSICKKIVEQYGGRIWLESQLGRGSRFHFTIPMGTGGSA